jgi:hypothetical protein
MSRTPNRWVMLLMAMLATGACRYRYEELSRTGQPSEAGASNTGTSGSAGGNNMPEGGAPGGGGVNAMGGSQASAGSGTSGGTAGAGSDDLAGAGGDVATPGASGAGGAGPTAACSDSADCTCDELAGHTYWFCTQHLYWNDAQAHCRTAGMDLVRVDSQAENDFLVDAGTARGVFEFNNFAQIGASSQAQAGEWRWPDGTLLWQGGSNGDPVGGLYSNWDTSSPSSSGASRCSGILTSGIWQDRTCTGAEPFICESP